MAPEFLKDEKELINSKSDIWSLGIIIYYLKNILIMEIMNIKYYKILILIRN